MTERGFIYFDGGRHTSTGIINGCNVRTGGYNGGTDARK
jgi:hypothetical protein